MVVNVMGVNEESTFGARVDQLKQLLSLGSEEAPAEITQETGQTTGLGTKEEALRMASLGLINEMSGRRIGQFQIEKELGRGGMGIVYLAQDTKLNRPVAIKSLPPKMVDNPQVRSRLQREARLLASLNHPNIATIYEELEEGEGIVYLVLEYIPGLTLAEQLAQKSFKLEDALKAGQQIAEALAAAHDRGVIHRDLKPGNIKIMPEGRVKVLDFGLAKTTRQDLPDQTGTMTLPGRVMGTPAYMSPEQARGQAVDHRSDIWAFGCTLYEMLTGTVPFKGETVADTLACILERDPNWQALPQDTPVNIQVLLRRCLEKDTHKRLQHMGDAYIEISETLSGTASSGVVPVASVGSFGRIRKRLSLPWLIVSLTAVAIVVSIMIKNSLSPSSPNSQAGGPATRYAVTLAPSQQFDIDIWASSVALPPNGQSLVYVADENGQRRLYLHNTIKAFTPKPIDGTEGAHSPFFSADGESIAFFAEGKLRKVLIESGTVTDICVVEVTSRGGAWGPDNTIYFNMNPGSGLFKVSAAGGKGEFVTQANSIPGDSRHCFPQILPGGDTILFTNATGNNPDQWHIAVLSLDTGRWRDLGLRGSNAHYVRTGHLVYAGPAGRLLAVPFDPDRLTVVGSPKALIENAVTYPTAQYCVSESGTLVYVPGGIGAGKDNTLVWVDPAGTESPLGLPPRAYGSVRLSPDGGQLAVHIGALASDCDIHLCDMARRVLTRLTFNEGWDVRPRWAPVSNRLTYSSARKSPPQLHWVAPDGSAEERLWDCDPNALELPGGWSSDERYFAFVHITEETQFDIWVLSLEDGRQADEFLGEPYNEKKPTFHPQGNWIAYASDETGQYEIYLRRFPDGHEKTLVSTDGGNDPMWDPSGEALYYRKGNTVMSVVVETEPVLSAKQPQALFEGPYERNEWGTSYDVTRTPDGARFIMIKLNQEASAVKQLNVILNWSEELKRLVPPE